MAQKLSLKLLKTIVVQSGGITYEALIEKLEKDGVTYNEPMVQGVILESLEKGNFIVTDGGKDKIVKATFGPKPRQSTGGGTPTHMYCLKGPLKPDVEKMAFQEKPYDKDFLESDEGALWATTRLGAVKKAKSHFYNTVYWPGLEQYRLMEESLAPAAKGGDEAPAGEEGEPEAA